MKRSNRVAGGKGGRGAPKRHKSQLQAARDSAVESLRMLRRAKVLGLEGLEAMEKKSESLIAELMLKENDDDELPSDVIDMKSRETIMKNIAELEKLDKELERLKGCREMLFEEIKRQVQEAAAGPPFTIKIQNLHNKDDSSHFIIKRSANLWGVFSAWWQIKKEKNKDILPLDRLRFLSDGVLIGKYETAAELDLKDNDIIVYMQEQCGDVGVFDKYASFPGSDLLSQPRKSFTAEQEERTLALAVRSLPPPPGLKNKQLLEPFWSCNRNRLNLVAPAKRQSLMELLDKHFAKNAQCVDVKVDLEKDELVSHIGSKAYEELEKLFHSELGGRPNAFLLRRVSAIGLHIAFHHDHALRTMQVALNDDYRGGRLVFVEEDPTGGLKLVNQDRPAGSITCHNNGVVHGVTRVESGVRYSLFFLQK